MALVVLAGIAGFFVYRLASPPNRVQVVIRNLPADTYFACLVADSGETRQSMEWSIRSMYFEPFTMHPARGAYSYTTKRDIGAQFDAFVNWREGTRYGLAMRGKDLRWRVVWYEAREVRVSGRWPVLGGGSVQLDASQGIPVPFADADVAAAGLGDVLGPP